MARPKRAFADVLRGAGELGIVEAADGFLSVFRALGAKGGGVSRLASLLGVIAIANRPKLPTIATDTVDGTPHV